MLTLPMGWVEDIAIAPSGSLAAVTWVDQTESGVEIVSWYDGTLKQIRGAGFYGDSSVMASPTFSSDCRFIVLAYGFYAWWVDDDLVDDSSDDFSCGDYLNTPSRGGDVLCGQIVVGDLETNLYRVSDLVVSVEPGWLPSDPERAAYCSVQRPIFRNRDSFTVGVMEFGEQVFSVHDGRIWQ
jgi:hypothetical protein